MGKRIAVEEVDPKVVAYFSDHDFIVQVGQKLYARYRQGFVEVFLSDNPCSRPDGVKYYDDFFTLSSEGSQCEKICYEAFEVRLQTALRQYKAMVEVKQGVIYA